jgi:hypothetical protein
VVSLIVGHGEVHSKQLCVITLVIYILQIGGVFRVARRSTIYSVIKIDYSDYKTWKISCIFD